MFLIFCNGKKVFQTNINILVHSFRFQAHNFLGSVTSYLQIHYNGQYVLVVNNTRVLNRKRVFIYSENYETLRGSFALLALEFTSRYQ